MASLPSTRVANIEAIPVIRTRADDLSTKQRTFLPGLPTGSSQASPPPENRNSFIEAEEDANSIHEEALAEAIPREKV